MALKVKWSNATSLIISKLVRKLLRAISISQQEFANSLEIIFPTIIFWKQEYITLLKRIDILLQHLGDRSTVL